jgi:hypothetical protein
VHDSKINYELNTLNVSLQIIGKNTRLFYSTSNAIALIIIININNLRLVLNLSRKLNISLQIIGKNIRLFYSTSNARALIIIINNLRSVHNLRRKFSLTQADPAEKILKIEKFTDHVFIFISLHKLMIWMTWILRPEERCQTKVSSHPRHPPMTLQLQPEVWQQRRQRRRLVNDFLKEDRNKFQRINELMKNLFIHSFF